MYAGAPQRLSARETAARSNLVGGELLCQCVKPCVTILSHAQWYIIVHMIGKDRRLHASDLEPLEAKTSLGGSLSAASKHGCAADVFSIDSLDL